MTVILQTIVLQAILKCSHSMVLKLLLVCSRLLGGAHFDKSCCKWAPCQNCVWIASKTGTLVLFSENRHLLEPKKPFVAL